jgi:hypothetical protein
LIRKSPMPMLEIPRNTSRGTEDPRNIMSCNIRMPYVAGNDHARTVIGAFIKRRSRTEHPLWSIITEVEQLADKAVVMRATIKDMLGTVIATARKKETEIGFPDYIEKAETGAIGSLSHVRI